MATLTLLRNLDVIFNVDHSVGKYGRNHTADVQLVQYLLNLVIAKPGGLELTPLGVPKLLVTSGICARETNDAILWFQKANNSLFNVGLAEDATINHADDLSYPLPHRSRYTIYHLNHWLKLGGRLPLKVADIPPFQPLRSELEKGLRKSGNRTSYIAS